MRMNLMGSSQEDPRIMYIVHREEIWVYQFSTLTPSGLPTLIQKLKDPRWVEQTDEEDNKINVIKVGYLGSEEVVVTADEFGYVCVWFTTNLQRDPLLLSVTESAWGIAIHSEQRLIAISSNAHNATVFYCGTDSRLLQRSVFRETGSSSGDVTTSDQTTASSSLGGSIPTPLIDQASQQILTGHGHNIPSVAFSPCGKFVATASIDRTCRTWRLSDGKQIQGKSLAQLWGWGVVFVEQDAWTTMSRSEYKRISKDHLRPGQSPGRNVRDCPFSISTSSQRRLPPTRDPRVIRSRWYAGPLYNTSCDEQGSEDDHVGDDDPQRNWRYGVIEGEDYYNDLDDRDAALFGMDDDEGEDEWEGTSTRTSGSGDDTDEADDEAEENDEDDLAQTHSRNPTTTTARQGGLLRIPRPAQDFEVSADTGNDGDNEEAGIDTEDGGGTTTEDGGVAAAAATRSALTRSRNERRMSSATITRATVSSLTQYVESSSEQDLPMEPTHSSSQRSGPPTIPVVGADAAMTAANGFPCQEVHQDPQQEEEEAGFNHDPSRVIMMELLDDAAANQPPHGQGQGNVVVRSGSSQQPRPKYPIELLLCATARNIYVLGQHPVDEPQTTTTGGAAEGTSLVDWSEGLPAFDWSANSHDQNSGEDDEEEEDENDDNGDSSIVYANYWSFGNPYDQDADDYSSDEEEGDAQNPEQEATNGLLSMSDADDDDHDQQDEEDENISLDDTLVPTSHDHHHDDHSHLNGRPSRFGYLFSDSLRSTVEPLSTISVARAAATRADGRGYRLLDQFDRLFVMQTVPELSVLIAASQKGTITVFRLLRVVDDPPPVQPMVPSPPSPSPSPPQAQAQVQSSHAKATASKRTFAEMVRQGLPQQDEPTTNSSKERRDGDDAEAKDGEEGVEEGEEENPPRVTIHGTKYVLFPEMYLPRAEPPPFPLIGVSMVPLQRTHKVHRSSSRPVVNGSNTMDGNTATTTSSRSSAGNRTHPYSYSHSSVCASSSASFLLHLVYMDSQLFSYEIRLRHDKDDPVSLSNIFL
ncbi:hypothetical protein BGX31_009991 [Mortierella sp. GBA43]|nr:hypothetical protein BGX31_009991 [Mortierella sp. GBA43]